MLSFLMQLRDEALSWCYGKNGWVRLPLLLGFVFYVGKTFACPTSCSIFSPINLAFHEAGHLLFGYGGTFWGILGGTLLECLMPFFLALHFYKQREFFGISLCFGWLATVFWGVATYAGDARAMALPLVTLFGNEPSVAHDWNYLLDKAGLLPYDFAVAFLFRAVSIGSLGLCLVTGFWLIRYMIAQQGAARP